MKTLIIGASTNPERYAYLAANRLVQHRHEIVLLGQKTGEVLGHKIETEKTQFTDIDTVTLYVSPKNQPAYQDYIIGLKPRRVIFNPGAENPALENILTKNGIEAIEACTLVMLSIGNY